MLSDTAYEELACAALLSMGRSRAISAYVNKLAPTLRYDPDPDAPTTSIQLPTLRRKQSLNLTPYTQDFLGALYAVANLPFRTTRWTAMAGYVLELYGLGLSGITPVWFREENKT